MNLSDGSFLVLDIGTSCVRAFGARIKGGRITTSDIQTSESQDSAYALKSAIDGLESHIGRHFDAAYVTGNFGFTKLDLVFKSTKYHSERKISAADIYNQISSILPNIDKDMTPIHMIPMRYDISGFPNIASPIGQVTEQLTSAFSIISAERDGIANIQKTLRAAHIESLGLYDPMFIIGNTARPQKQAAIIIDMGASWISASVWTVRGPVFLAKMPLGLSRITDAIARGLDVTWAVAECIKRANMTTAPTDMDRFTPADSAYDFTRSDVNEIALPLLIESIDAIYEELTKAVEKHTPNALYISGGGAAIPGIESLFKDRFNMPVHNLGPNAAVQSCAVFIWNANSARIKAYLSRKKRLESMFSKFIGKFKVRKKQRKNSFVPIMPTTLSFDMEDSGTYKMFDSAGISMIHCDIMDGFYVDNVVGSIEWLRNIRGRTDAQLHVHLMTESPLVWAQSAADAGADTIILSTGTAGVRAGLKKIRDIGKRCGIALHPETPLSALKPILREIDEVLVMSVAPGYGGQEFIPAALDRIRTLYNTRKKYNLGFKITVDGGINDKNAQDCWDAGADFLVSGTYLANAPDFPLAVNSLLKRPFA